jgi:hypothetical protein
MRQESIEHQFVGDIPEELDEGVLYVSIQHRTVSHLCPCGCRAKVVTPIKPPKWHLTFDGDTVSLSPSVGNWQHPCRSHYWIRNNQILWAEAWTDAQIEAGRANDVSDVRRYYAARARQEDRQPLPDRQRNVVGRMFAAVFRRFKQARLR